MSAYPIKKQQPTLPQIDAVTDLLDSISVSERQNIDRIVTAGVTYSRESLVKFLKLKDCNALEGNGLH